MTRAWRLAPIALLLVVAAAPAAAADGRALLDQARQLARTTRKWTDRVQKLRLRIVDRRGGERERDLIMRFKKYPEERTRSTIFFQSPPDVKGVGFLQWADPHGKDVQWLYLPELKRVRQISAGSKRDSFMGTDFSYDDLAILDQILDWTEADARATAVREESVDGKACQVIEIVPAAKDLTYGKIVVWLTSAESVIVKYEMHDKEGTLEKRLELRDFRAIGAIPTAFAMEMNNLGGGSRTVVGFEEVKYDSGLSDDLFTQRALEQGP